MSETKWTEGPWEYVPSTEHHGPYVANRWGAGDICDCYVMSQPSALSTASGGPSRPIPHQHEQADANARLIAAAPDLYEALYLVWDKVLTEYHSKDSYVRQQVEQSLAKARGDTREKE